jgi:hypothetical protein
MMIAERAADLIRGHGPLAPEFPDSAHAAQGGAALVA